MLVLLVTAVKEIWEDFQRLKQDRKINRHKVLVLKGKEWVSTMWLDIKVGDLVKVENKEPFPADLVLLSSSEDQAMAYIETSNLDGETNLKVRNIQWKPHYQHYPGETIADCIGKPAWRQWETRENVPTGKRLC